MDITTESVSELVSRKHLKIEMKLILLTFQTDALDFSYETTELLFVDHRKTRFFSKPCCLPSWSLTERPIKTVPMASEH